MFELAEVGHKLSKEEYDREAPALRTDLLNLQRELKTANFPVILLVGGVDGAGKSETVNELIAWLDARGIDTHAFGEPSDEERDRPEFWRFWRALPPAGSIGIMFGAWYTDPLERRTLNEVSEAELDQSLQRIVDLEQMLVHDGALIIKIWLHLSRDQQRKRLKALRRDPLQSWRVTDEVWEFHKQYDAYRVVAERTIRKTSQGQALWYVVDGGDERYRMIRVATILRDAMVERFAEDVQKEQLSGPTPDSPVPLEHNLINLLDQSLSLSREEYRDEFARLQALLNRYSRRLAEKHRSMILVFEGPDAAGKGGAIRRIVEAMDARSYKVISIAAPTEQEKRYPYLWRFWLHLPRSGRVTLFDRSWYGRVLVERLEGFCRHEDWRRAYLEINHFEEQLHEFGIVLVKFWVAITDDEQMRRFKQREETPHKQYKMTAEDWRNREKWGAYEAAACDAIERTSTDLAPWTLVEGNDKRWARIKILRTICERLQAALDAPEPTEE